MAGEEGGVLCVEAYGSRRSRRYVRGLNGELLIRSEAERRARHTATDLLTSVFLPQGYPDSVSGDYLTYQIWDTVQAFASSITGTLAMQAVLKGVGVGDTTATVAGATSTWILKDGTSMLGRILFAWLKGSELDCDAKKWRLVADILNDVAILIEIIAPVFPAIFTLILCVSGVLKAVVGVAGGATRAALTLHQARRDNMADVSAKDGSQETLVNLAGLLFSLFLTPLVTGNARLTYLLFALFTSLHLYANYRAVRGVVMETLNRARLGIVLRRYLRDGIVPNPRSVNQQEPLLPGLHPRSSIRIGAPLHYVIRSVEEYQRATAHNEKNYLLGVIRNTDEVSVALRDGAGSEDVIQAYVHAELLRLLLSRDIGQLCPQASVFHQLQEAVRHAPDERMWDVVTGSHGLMDALFPRLLEELRGAGWLTDRHLLSVDEWRAMWGPETKKLW
eukprot:gi/632989403/ref/XP_007883630.1/ PREDICTED: UPF0420 protein C16orf58 homolog [Callorhinchus milii]